ncbi:MAG: sugar phosphate isomerase/epimerase, partial [Anaerolineae bacterium]|nr:sugar phosphate isomerase/epimerase [Anaerolineae bacterium]
TFSTGSLYTYDLERCCALAAEAGFDGLEIMIDARPETHSPDRLREVSDRYRLPICSLHAPFPGRSIPGWEPGPVASVTQAVALAETVGARHVVMHTPNRLRSFKLPLRIRGQRVKLPWFADTAGIRDWMRAGGLRRLQAESPVRVCVENMPTMFDVLGRIAPGINQQAVFYWNTLETWPQAHDYLTLDTTHWATHGVKPLAAYRAGGARVRHIHLSNFKDGEEHHLPQHGELDLVGFLRTLAAEAFDGQIVVEVKPPRLGGDDEARVRASLAETVAFCRAALAG